MNRARKIFIYTDIPEARERRPKQRTLPELLRNRARRAFDFAQWRALGRVRFQHYSYADREFSNAGDIAIRIAIEEDLQRAFAPTEVEFIEYGFGDLNAEVVERANREADLFVITGGAYIHYNSEGSINRRLREDLPYVEKLICPLITFGISVSSQLAPGRDVRTSQLAPESMELLRRFRNRLALCSVRDEQSRTIFEVAGGKPIHLISDPVLFLQHPGTAGLSGSPRVGVNLTFHGAHAGRLLERNLKIY
ncbi:MAG: polysaccharide pyruvyl transferase family protein, partial [Bryobacteraceae bacterium]